MTEDELFDLLTEIDLSASRDKAREFEKAAAGVPAGEHGRASLLVAAGDHWQMRQKYDEARRCFEEARDDGGESSVDPEAYLLDLALEEGDDEAAARQLATLKAVARRDELSAEACHVVGESLEERGRLQEAHRWFTMPLTWTEEDDLDVLCLAGRLRVREALGLPRDRFDAIALEERAARHEG
jgi:YD repeat-containing protein